MINTDSMKSAVKPYELTLYILWEWGWVTQTSHFPINLKWRIGYFSWWAVSNGLVNPISGWHMRG